MPFITLDFETFYGDGLGFKTQTNEEYLRDPRFEVIGVSVKVDDGTPLWFSGSHEEIKHFLMQFDWENSAVLAHNTLFDGAILAWHFGITPAFYYDTLCMARAIHGVDAGGSLAALSDYYGIGKKGTEVVTAYGKRRQDFTSGELASYGAYCCNDTELTYKLFQILHEVRPIGDTNVFEQFRYLGKTDRPKVFSEDEYTLIDMTLRMYIHPTLKLDDALLKQRLDDMAVERSQVLHGLANHLKVTAPDDIEDEDKRLAAVEEGVRKKLSSNQKFAEVLRELGIEPPMKPGKPDKNGMERMIFAFAKTDEAFIELQDHPESIVQELCAARLGTKSTQEKGRILRFMGIGGRNRGYLPVPLKYYGAHTGRWGGDDKINMQNLPSRDKKKKTLKNAVIAPPGHVIINCDSSQIEARIMAYIARDTPLVAQFMNKLDVYSIFASDIFKRLITKADPVERFVGKTCVLGLQFGTGAAKLQHTLKTTPPGAELAIDKCAEIVKLYREVHKPIQDFWKTCEHALRDIAAWPEEKEAYWLNDCVGMVEVTPEGFRLPNGLYIRYPNLRRAMDPSRSETAWYYDSRKGPQKLWGGVIAENIVQALARIVVGEQMVAINTRYRVGLTVHDAAVNVVPEAELDTAVKFIVKVMSTPPTWAPGLPVACEATWGPSYGEPVGKVES